MQDIIGYGYVRGVVDSGLTVIEVTQQNLPFAYANYGITSIGVILIESRYTDDLRLGDKIVAIDEKQVKNAEDVSLILKTHSVGDAVTIKVERNGSTLYVELVLREKLPDTVDFD